MTFTEAALQRLDGLWRALYGEACPTRPRALAQKMLAPWGGAPIPREPSWRSDIGDDHKGYFAGEAALKAGGVHNTMNQFG